MKRLTFILLILSLSLSTMAQSSSSHLTFKGVAIDGKLSDFVAKMTKVGFHSPNAIPKEFEDKIRNAGWGGLIDLAKLSEDTQSAHLEGTFAGYNNCDIYVNTLSSADIVCNVVVKYPYQYDWANLNDNYVTLKNMLTEKYGTPSICKEEIPGDIKNYYDRDKAFEEGSGAWFSQYNLSNGKIILYLKTSHVELHYIDNANTSLQRTKAIEDL